jgi:hypothetical protein
MENPLHVIEQWTGRYFRLASLWEVGIFIPVPHCRSNSCESLQWQGKVLETLQKANDINDANYLDDHSKPANARCVSNVNAGAGLNFDEPDDSILEEDEEEGPLDAEAEINEVDAGSHFLHYMENSA